MERSRKGQESGFREAGAREPGSDAEALKAHALDAMLGDMADRYPDRTYATTFAELPLFADRERGRFLAALSNVDPAAPVPTPNRTQDRLAEEAAGVTEPTGADSEQARRTFANEPDSDPALAANRQWARDIAARMRDSRLGADAVGRHVDAVALDPAVRDFLLSGEEERDVVITTATRVLALNRQPATSNGRNIGTVTTMRDSTELASMQSQLSSHKSVTDTLRAQTHEFANQLHTISGLAQLGEYDAVTDFVGTLTRRRAQISDAVTHTECGNAAGPDELHGADDHAARHRGRPECRRDGSDLDSQHHQPRTVHDIAGRRRSGRQVR